MPQDSPKIGMCNGIAKTILNNEIMTHNSTNEHQIYEASNTFLMH